MAFVVGDNYTFFAVYLFRMQEDYNASHDKLQCPQCKKPQSFDEVCFRIFFLDNRSSSSMCERMPVYIVLIVVDIFYFECFKI